MSTSMDNEMEDSKDSAKGQAPANREPKQRADSNEDDLITRRDGPFRKLGAEGVECL